MVVHGLRCCFTWVFVWVCFCYSGYGEEVDMRYCPAHQRGLNKGVWTDLPRYSVQIALAYAHIFAFKLQELEITQCDLCVARDERLPVRKDGRKYHARRVLT